VSETVSEVPTIAVDLRALVGVPTGIGYATLSLLRELAHRNTGHFLGMAHRTPSNSEQLRSAGVALEDQAALNGLWWQQVTLPRRLRRGGVDLLWSPLITLPRRLPVPGVVTIHDLTPFLLPSSHTWKVRLSVVPFFAATLRQARRIVVSSEATAADMRQHFPASSDRLRVIHLGVDAEFRPASADEIAATRREVGCPGGYLLFAGTLEPRKNLGSLLSAWEDLRRRRDDMLPLLIVGPYGWNSQRLAAKLRRLKPLGLHHLGHLPRSRLVQVMQAASVFIYPSLYEGFGLPPAEAMACGVPTVVSDRSSLPEVVGDAGLKIDPDNPGDLARAISSLLDDPARAAALGQQGRDRSRRFTWSSAARAMEEIFAEVLG
jgi:alpha-1,3-rhamnosyl/mannosyltransferase